MAEFVSASCWDTHSIKRKNQTLTCSTYNFARAEWMTTSKCLKGDTIGVVVQTCLWLPADLFTWSLHMSSYISTPCHQQCFACVKQILLPHRTQYSAAVILYMWVFIWIKTLPTFMSMHNTKCIPPPKIPIVQLLDAIRICKPLCRVWVFFSMSSRESIILFYTGDNDSAFCFCFSWLIWGQMALNFSPDFLGLLVNVSSWGRSSLVHWKQQILYAKNNLTISWSKGPYCKKNKGQNQSKIVLLYFLRAQQHCE